MAVTTKMVALAELLDGGFSKSSIRKAFSRFSCERDQDVSLFLKAHAMQNEGTGASRTYLALSSDARDDRYTHEDFDASELLPFAEDVISGAISVVGGRFAYVDCHDGLVGYYGRQDYEPLYYDAERGLHKLIKPLF